VSKAPLVALRCCLCFRVCVFAKKIFCFVFFFLIFDEIMKFAIINGSRALCDGCLYVGKRLA